MKYDDARKQFEPKWQKTWEKSGIYNAKTGDKKPKYYALFEFPYPSGAGMHVGHVRSQTAMDIISRKRRMEGFNVLYPIGWDAFGLPTENYAIKMGIDPAVATKQNTDNFRRQLKAMGFSLDWEREIDTTDPEYYKWTQWMFLKFFEKGLAYKAKTYINWCPKDKIGLANEEAAGGVCDRCGGPVEKREKEQWMIAITKYADKLLKGLEGLDYIPQAVAQQTNWIGRSEGAEIDFKTTAGEDVKVFTTRLDTIFGATYMVLAPEHQLVQSWKSKITNWSEVEKYIASVKNKPEEERLAEGKEKKGIELKGVKAINPATKQEIPVWIADYVLSTYGTGAIMAVPAHDERDFAFATKYKLPIRKVILPAPVSKLGFALNATNIAVGMKPEMRIEAECWTDEGELINSGVFNGLKSEVARKKITEALGAKLTVKYKLRDWVFSRQRYWGEPIPLIKCEGCGWVAVPEKELPVKLPKVEKYQPTDTGESPLSAIESFVNVKCPKCKKPAKRETDTMPNWAGSSWYFLRYLDPKNKKEFASKKALKYFMPVDWYNGGMEHTVLHLLYSRFWNMFLHDLGLVPTSEPYKKRTSHGMVLAADGSKMSKSLGNVINPDDIIAEFGADALRMYEMFMGPFNQAISWDPHGILGCTRFLEKVYRVGTEKIVKKSEDTALTKLLHKTIKKVGEDIESMSFNTAISAMMVFMNEAANKESVPSNIWKSFLQILAPFAPHLAEELWGEKKSIHISEWPTYDPALIIEESFELIIQVNGKVRDKVSASMNISQADAEKLAMSREETKKWLTATPKKVVFVPNRLINFIV